MMAIVCDACERSFSETPEGESYSDPPRGWLIVTVITRSESWSWHVCPDCQPAPGLVARDWTSPPLTIAIQSPGDAEEDSP